MKASLSFLHFLEELKIYLVHSKPPTNFCLFKIFKMKMRRKRLSHLFCKLKIFIAILNAVEHICGTFILILQRASAHDG